MLCETSAMAVLPWPKIAELRRGYRGSRVFRMAFLEARTRYAKRAEPRGDAHIAYRVFGAGPRDIVLVPGTASHVEIFWELPANQYLLKRLAAFARVIVFDKRGQGLSDRVAEYSRRSASATSSR